MNQEFFEHIQSESAPAGFQNIAASTWLDATAMRTNLNTETNNHDMELMGMLSEFDVSPVEPSESNEPVKQHGIKDGGEMLEKLLDSAKDEKKFPNGLTIKRISEGTYEITCPGISADRFTINTAKNTVTDSEKRECSLNMDASGNIIIENQKKDSMWTVKKDGSVLLAYRNFRDSVEREYPAHGNFDRYSRIFNADKLKGRDDTYSIRNFREPFKAENGSEIEFEYTKAGCTVTVKSKDGKKIVMADQVLTITDKDGKSETYGPRDGKRVEQDFQTRSDWYVELPNGIIANFGGNGRTGILIKNADGSTTYADYGEGRPSVVTKRTG